LRLEDYTAVRMMMFFWVLAAVCFSEMLGSADKSTHHQNPEGEHDQKLI
jgi:hypothetical protein